MPYCSRLILCLFGGEAGSASGFLGHQHDASQTYIVLLLWGHGIDKVILVHEPLSILVFLRMAEEIGTGLLRQLRLLCAAHQFLLDGFLDTTHCGSEQKTGVYQHTLDKGPNTKNPPQNLGEGRKIGSGEGEVESKGMN